jgi:hypothetical protein
LRLASTDPLQDCQAVESGKRQIQNRQVIIKTERETKGLFSIARDVDRIVLRLQPFSYEYGQRVIVFSQQDSHSVIQWDLVCFLQVRRQNTSGSANEPALHFPVLQ